MLTNSKTNNKFCYCSDSRSTLLIQTTYDINEFTCSFWPQHKLVKGLTILTDTHSRLSKYAAQAVCTVQAWFAPSCYVFSTSAPLPLLLRTQRAATATVHVLQVLIACNRRAAGLIARRATPADRRCE